MGEVSHGRPGQSARLTGLDLNAVLSGKAVCADGRRVLAVLVVLLADFLQLVLAVLVLVVLPLAGAAGLAQAMQRAQRSLGLGAACLDALQHRLLHLVAHLDQGAARRNGAAAGARVEHLFHGGAASPERAAERLLKVRGRGP